MAEQALLPHLFRIEYRKIIAVICRAFGMEDIEVAEDLVSETFLNAAETWGLKGLPENPTAWLYRVASNKATDYLRRKHLFDTKISPTLLHTEETAYELKIDLSAENINDSQLQMMFAVCHPSISKEAQIGLSLNILCGFGVEEIADAFLSNKETIYKRISRAKSKLREDKIKIEVPSENEISLRLDSVLTTLYLLFSEGYYSSSSNHSLRKELCLEAMRLNVMLLDYALTNTPAAAALLSLMCFHSSRFESRIQENGETVLYDEQNQNLWNIELIEKGVYYLNLSSRGQTLTKYHLEAAIAYWHTQEKDSIDKWENILQLYNKLLIIEYSPVAALNRTYALARARNKKEAITEAEKLKLVNNHLYFSLLGYLYTDIDKEKAIHHYQSAIAMTKSTSEIHLLKKKLTQLTTT